MAPTSDMMDMMQLVVREVIRNELRLKVESKFDGDKDNFTVSLELGGEVIPDAYAVFSLDAGIHGDDIEFEVV